MATKTKQTAKPTLVIPAAPSKAAPASKPTPAPASTSNGSAMLPGAATLPPATKLTRGGKKARTAVTLLSATVPGYWVRAYVDVLEQHGMPRDPSGQPMVLGRVARAASGAPTLKERLAAMSEEERKEYRAAKREERKAAVAAKKQAERDALVAELRAQLLAGTL